FWKRFYEKQYGAKNLSFVMEKMERSKVSFKWRELYEAKLKVVEEDEKEAVDQLQQRYKNEDAILLLRLHDSALSISSLPKRTGLSANLPSTSRSNSCGEQVKNLTAVKRNTTHPKEFQVSFILLLFPPLLLLPHSLPLLLYPSSYGNIPFGTYHPSTSRSNSYGEGNLPPKRINSLTGIAPSTSRSISYGEGNLPPKRINSLSGTAPSTSRNTATKRKHVV
ncbi:hypothetical protein F2Q69_00002147, partial [Brassica cretica]